MKIRVAVLLLSMLLVPQFAHGSGRFDGLPDMIRRGEAKEARARLQAAIEAARAESDQRGEAVGLVLLAFADIALNDSAAARKNLALAAEKLTAGGDSFSAWMALLYIAAVDMRELNWAAAVESHQAALAMLRQAREDEKPFTLDAIEALGPLFGMPFGDAGVLLKAQPEMFKPMLLSMAEMMSRDALGATYLELNELARAEEELTRAGDLSAMFFGVLDGSIAANVGELRRRQWRFDEARRSYLKALNGAKRMPILSFRHDSVELNILGHLAEIESITGRLEEALRWNDRALQVARASRMPGRDIPVLAKRSSLLTRAGRFAEGLQVLDEALKIAEKSGSIAQQASILTDQATLQMFGGDYGEAVATFEKAIGRYGHADDSLSEAHTWTMLAQANAALGAADGAEVALDRARELAAKVRPVALRVYVDASISATAAMVNGPSPEAFHAVDMLQQFAAEHDVPIGAGIGDLLREMMAPSGAAPDITARDGAAPFAFVTDMVKLLEGRTRLVRGDTAGAREIWSSTLANAATGDMRVGLQAGIAATYWNEGNAEEAIRWLKKAVAGVEGVAGDIDDDELLARYLGSERRWYYEMAVEMMLRDGRVEEAFHYAERARARAFLQLVGNHRIAPQRGGAEAVVREAEALRAQIAEWERRGSTLPGDLRNARKRYRVLLRRMKSSNPEYASLMNVEPLQIESIRAELPEGAVLVNYFVTFNGAHAWVLDREKLEHVALPATKQDLRRLTCWSARYGGEARRGARVRLAPLECADSATPEQAYEMLFAPLRERIGSRRLIIVPHGALHYVPFGALRDARSSRYLVEDYTISIAPSASALQFLREKETPVEGGVLVLGNPDTRLAALPGAKREAVAVARDLQTTPLLGGSAAESLLYDLRGQTDLLHIASHATYDPVNPIFSRVALAAGDGCEGNLEVHEILSDVDLRGVNLVVLSACQTAVGERSGGDDVVGLTRALLYAGSPGVISTLWDIDDEAASVLMEELYCGLLSGASVADALRSAQLALLHNERYRDPEHWAAFTLTGDPQGRWGAPR